MRQVNGNARRRINRLIENFDGTSRMTRDEDFEWLTEWIQADEWPEGEGQKAVPLHRLSLSDEDALDYAQLEEGEELTDEIRLACQAARIECHVSGESGDVCFPWIGSRQFRSRKQRKGIVIGYGFSGYSMEGIRTEWYGVFANRQAFDEFARAERLIRDVSELEEIPAEERLKDWSRRKPPKRTAKKKARK